MLAKHDAIKSVLEKGMPIMNLLRNFRWHKETILAMLGCYESIRPGKIAKVGGLFRKARR